ncbi:MAG: GNAT family N-acetyltransferase [Chitinophagales bacterium]|nr:GNAT family N-acetyltransferase [Chitinophagales bacterium]
MITWQLKHFNQLTTVELYTILQLRSEVFVVEQTCPYLDPDGKDIYCHHLMGYMGNDLAAYSRLVPAGVSYAEVSIGRVISSPKYRGQQYGKLLMQKAIEEIEQLYGSAPIRIGAQAYLKQFYEGFDFVDLNQPYLEDGIPHIIMLRKA